MAERRPGRRSAVVPAAVVAVLAAAVLAASCSQSPERRAEAQASPLDTAPETVFTEPPTGDAPFRFVDVTEQAGLAVPQSAEREELPFTMNGGAAVSDYDRDGDFDVYLTRRGLPNLLMRNRGDGTFEDVAGPSGVATINTSGTPVFADVDGDGDSDLLVTGIGETGYAKLYINDGAGRFTDEAEARGVRTDLITSQGKRRSKLYGATFGDTDRDGDLDLIVTQWFRDDSVRVAPRTRFLENDGAGFFTDRTEDVGLDTLRTAAGFTPTLHDVDGDGWEDLLVAADWKTSRAMRNVDGERFEDVTDAWGVGREYNGMGSVVTDLDGDGNIEWFVTSINYPGAKEFCPGRDTNARDDGWAGGVGCDGNALYEWDGDRFRDVTDEFGVRSGYWGWGATAADFDLDGTPELAMTNGIDIAPNGLDLDPQDPMSRFVVQMRNDPNRLWRRGDGDGPWLNVAEATGFANTADGKALVGFDMDGDGDLDVLQANTYTSPILYRNDLANGANWLRVRPTEANGRNGTGATIEVTPEGGRLQRRWVKAGGMYMGQEPYTQTFGLGDATKAEVTVIWPGGERQEVGIVDAGQTLVVPREVPDVPN